MDVAAIIRRDEGTDLVINGSSNANLPVVVKPRVPPPGWTPPPQTVDLADDVLSTCCGFVLGKVTFRLLHAFLNQTLELSVNHISSITYRQGLSGQRE